MISPASIDDAQRAAALIAACSDDRFVTAIGIRYRIESGRPEDGMGYWRAERDGELVGWAYGGLNSFASIRSVAFANIVVHSSYRRQGVGSALWDVLSSHLDRIGARRILVWDGAPDEESMAFPRARGFSLAATATSSVVDPRTVAAPPAPPAGIELQPTSCFADDPEPIYVADKDFVRDEPGPGDYSGMTYETWRRHLWENPDKDRELSMVALADGVVVGSTFLHADRASGRGANGGTGVIRAFRGQGIGLLMKQHSLARGAAAGITRVITENDETNAPMLAINARLGYEPCGVEHSWVLER